MGNRLLESKFRDLANVRADLDYWVNKDPAFWDSWRGCPLDQIVERKLAQIKDLEEQIRELERWPLTSSTMLS